MTPGQENVALKAYTCLTPHEGIISNLYVGLHHSGMIATRTE